MECKLVSKYKDNKIASTKKVIFSRLLDYFLTFIIGYLIFNISMGISNFLPSMRNIETNLNQIVADLNQLVDETHLQRTSEDKTSIITVEEDAKQYAETLVKTNAYIYDLYYPVKDNEGIYNLENKIKLEETFLYEAGNYSKDHVSYYFKVFKYNDKSLNNYVFDGVDYKNNIDEFVYSKIMGFDNEFSNNYFVFDKQSLTVDCSKISSYLIVKKDVAEALINHVVYNDNSNNNIVNLYTKIQASYKVAIDYGTKDVENNCQRFISLSNDFTNIYNRLTKIYAISYFVSYFVSYIILMLFARKKYKRWVTFGQGIMKVAISTTEDNEPEWWNVLIYHFVTFLTFSTSCIFGLGYSKMIGVLNTPIIGSFKLIYIFIFFVIVNIGSLIFTALSKNKFNVSSFPARILYKDIEDSENKVVDSPNQEKVYESSTSTNDNVKTIDLTSTDEEPKEL